MLTNNKNTIVRWILSGILVVFATPLTFLTAQAAEDCSDAFYINETLPNGARWDMCWEAVTVKGLHSALFILHLRMDLGGWC